MHYWYFIILKYHKQIILYLKNIILKKSTLFLSTSIILFFIIILVISPKLCVEACFNGLSVWATSLLPALLPFFIFTKLLSELGVVNKASNIFSPITKKLYNTNGISGYIYLMSILSGYPVGAKLTKEMFEDGHIDLGQAHRIMAFTSTSGPLFILGTVAIGMFNNPKIGYVVLISHFVGAMLNGLIYRNYMIKTPKNEVYSLQLKNQSNNMLEETMYSSIKSILIVGGYVSVFFMIISVLNHYNVLYPINYLICKILPFTNINTVSAITNGFIELTKGCLDLSGLNLPNKVVAPIISGLVSFGGISIFLQASTFLKSININLKFYFAQKITHCFISVILAIIFSSFMF